MEENNNMQENGSIFANMNSLDDEPKKDLYAGLDTATFGEEADMIEEKDTTTDNPAQEQDAYIPCGQMGNTSMKVPEKKESKALEICALVFGIISLCGCCYGLFGMIGLVLSIIALATGKKSGFSITGLILSIVGIVGALAWTIFCFSATGEEWRTTMAENFMERFGQENNGIYEDVTTEAEQDEVTTAEQDETADTESTEMEQNLSQNTSLKNELAGKVIIDGKEIRVPCKFSEIKGEFEISAESEEILKNGMKAYDFEIISLTSDGKSTGVSLVLSNYSDVDIEQADEAYVTGVNVDSYGEMPWQVKFFADIMVGMSEKDLEAAMNGMEYDKDLSDDYSYYSFCLGENSDYYFSIYGVGEKIEEIALSYYGDCE